MTYLIYALWGGVIGLISGVLGIGGGILIIPTLAMLFGLSQQQAQGTSLMMMVPPIGLLAALRYYKEGNVVMPIALLGALGFIIGGYFGAGLAHHLSEQMLRRTFGVLLIGVGVKMLLR